MDSLKELRVSADVFIFFPYFYFNLIKHRTASFIIVFFFQERFLWFGYHYYYNIIILLLPKVIIIIIIIIRNAKDVLNSI